MELATSRTIAFEDIDPVMHMMAVYKILSLQQVHKSVLLCIIHIQLVTILSSEGGNLFADDGPSLPKLKTPVVIKNHSRSLLINYMLLLLLISSLPLSQSRLQWLNACIWLNILTSKNSFSQLHQDECHPFWYSCPIPVLFITLWLQRSFNPNTGMFQ